LSKNVTDYGLRNLLTRGDSWSNTLREGELLQNQKLAEILEKIQTDGSNALYSGDQAALLAQEVQDAGGILTKEDIENYRPTIRSPLVAHNLNGFAMIGVPPPSSGGAVLMGAARFLSGYTSPLASHAETLSMHRISEASKHAFAIRMSLSDPDYNTNVVKQAVEDFTTGGYMEDLRKATRDNDILPLSHYGGSTWAQLNDTAGAINATDQNEGDRRRRLYNRFGYLNDHGTSHFSIVDSMGNAVSATTSVNTYFGSHVVSPSTGIIFSNTMDDFASPGLSNYYGLRPSESNYIKPGKKALSSMSPTMIFQQGGDNSRLGNLTLVLGGSGGPKIISAVLQVFLNNIMLGMPLFESMLRPRIHDQLIYHGAAVVTVEESSAKNQDTAISLSDTTRQALTRRNHRLLDVNYEGTVQAVAVNLETGTIDATSDVRKGGKPAGY
jgi:gamma-glutamyltranspeptidase